jgi:SAM domain (Sterile alpha motif)
MDISGWLRSQRFQRYEAAFVANAIDSDVLPELTEDDLERATQSGSSGPSRRRSPLLTRRRSQTRSPSVRTASNRANPMPSDATSP